MVSSVYFRYLHDRRVFVFQVIFPGNCTLSGKKGSVKRERSQDRKKESDAEEEDDKEDSDSEESDNQSNENENDPKKPKRTRTAYSNYQLDQLELVFTTTHYPDVFTREELSRRLGIREDRIQVLGRITYMHTYHNVSCRCGSKIGEPGFENKRGQVQSAFVVVTDKNDFKNYKNVRQCFIRPHLLTGTLVVWQEVLEPPRWPCFQSRSLLTQTLHCLPPQQCPWQPVPHPLPSRHPTSPR